MTMMIMKHDTVQTKTGEKDLLRRGRYGSVYMLPRSR